MSKYLQFFPFFLIFLGDMKIPVGISSVTVPLGILFIFPLFLISIFKYPLVWSRPSLLLFGVMLFGLAGSFTTSEASLGRSIAGMLPLIFSLMAVVAYFGNNFSSERAIQFMLAGGVVFATWVIILYFMSSDVIDGYYERKLLIETWLGRSNYLSAFLIFLVAISWPRNFWLGLYFCIAIFCTMSRGGMLMLVCFPLFFAISRRLLLGSLFFIVSLFMLSLIFLSLQSGGANSDILISLHDLLGDGFTSAINRVQLWVFGFDLWLSNPFLGVGPNTFRTFVELNGDIEDVWGVHNSILLLLLNYGFLGSVLYFIFLYLIYKKISSACYIDRRFEWIRTAFIILMVFGLFEPLIGSAAFELLLSLIYVMSRAAIGNFEVSMKIKGFEKYE